MKNGYAINLLAGLHVALRAPLSDGGLHVALRAPLSDGGLHGCVLRSL